MDLRDTEWKRIYESSFRGETSLTGSFYQPLLSTSIQYDRLAGYLSLQNLADALQGIESAFESDGEIRIIASKRLSRENKPVLTDDAPLSEEGESRLALIAQMLDEGRLQIKIGEPRNNSDSGIFHPKLGIATDTNGNRITFEGSINETYNAWYRNYERFKVHRSWDEVENEYVQEDVKTFERLWNEEHEDVEVTDIDEAIERDILDWQPESDEEVEKHVERLEKSSEPPASEATVGRIANERELLPGAVNIAEDISSIEPWPHQRVIADTATSIYPNSLLLADEVGLGKTIEAGLTISRLLTIGEVSDALLLVPATVQPQWQEELLEKFNINAYSYEYSGAERVLRDAYGVEHSLSDYETIDAWKDSHIGEFVTDRDGPTVILTSWHTARRTQNMGMFSPSVHSQETEATGESREEHFEWDLTLVDEAHHGRNGTNLYDLVTELQNDTACTYVLTATPMQLEITELFDLLRVCDLPGGWNERESFDTYFEMQQDLGETLDEIDAAGSKTVEEVLPDLASKWNYEPYEGMTHLRTWAGMIQSFVQAHDDVADWVGDRVDDSGFSLSERRRLNRVLGTGKLGPRDWEEKFSNLSVDSLRFLLDLGDETTPVKSRVFRNTRQTLRMCQQADLIDENIPRREIETRSVELGNAEPLYDRVETYISNVYDQSKKLLEGKEKTAIGFVMTTYRQRLTSSLHAIEESLKRRRENLKSDLRSASDVSETDLQTGDIAGREEVLRREYGLRVDQIGANSPAGERVRQFELSELEDFIARLYDVPEDPKLEQLMQDLNELSARARDTVIIFTQYTDTLDAIKEKVCLSHHDVGTYSGGGGEIYDRDEDEWRGVSKERVKREFTDPDGDLSILVCTDSASEGLNLQSCDAMINYDMPWNPQVVEQRIGRIDRIGQENEKVLIWNYIYDDTVEEDIYERLGERINLFEQAVGPLRPILDGLEGEVQDVAMGESAKSGEEVAADAEAKSKEAEQKTKQVGLVQDLDEVQPEDIIEEAKLYGWTQSHPDVGRIGYPDRPFDPLMSPEVVKRLFTQSQVLRNKGWTFEMLERELTDDEDAPYQKLYRLNIPEDADPPISTNPAEDTVQALFADSGEVLVSFDPEVLEWYPSVVVPLPQHGIFEYLLKELLEELEGTVDDEVVRIAGSIENGNPQLWTEPYALSPARVATYATKSARRLTLDVPLPDDQTGRQDVQEWLDRYADFSELE